MTQGEFLLSAVASIPEASFFSEKTLSGHRPIWDEIKEQFPDALPDRKIWEYCCIILAAEFGRIMNGAPTKPRAIGFGVGREPIPAMLAARGFDVLATDAPLSPKIQKYWRDGDCHSNDVSELVYPKLCAPEIMRERVTFANVDMLDLSTIPSEWRGVDFVWSANSLDHLGSLAAGTKFIADSLQLLGSLGVACHTTEYNTNLSDAHVPVGDTVFYRAQDIRDMFSSFGARNTCDNFADLADVSEYPSGVIFPSTDNVICTSVALNFMKL